MSLVKTDEKVSDIVAGEDDDEMTQLVRTKSTSVAHEASKLLTQAATDPDKANPPTNENIPNPLEDENKDLTETTAAPKQNNDRVRRTDARPTRVSQQEPFNKGLRPTKSVLKRSNHPIRTTGSTYESNTPASPTPSSPAAVASSTEKASEGGAAPARAARSPIQEERKCCVVM